MGCVPSGGSAEPGMSTLIFLECFLMWFEKNVAGR